MPVYSRAVLRQEFSQRLGDLYLGTVGSGQTVAAHGSAFFLDPTQADPSGSGQIQDLRAYILHAGVTYRCASYNFASGAWVSGQMAATTIGPGDAFEVHRQLSPADKNLCIDRTVSRLRVRQEVPINSLDSARQYNIDSAASPQSIRAVLECYYWAAGTATGNRDGRYFRWFGTEQTATGMELRINPPIAGSLNIIMDAILDVTLGASDSATINYPNDQTIVWGAINQAIDLQIQRSPGQEAGRYLLRRNEAAAMWSKLIGLYNPFIDRRIMFDEDPFNKGVR